MQYREENHKQKQSAIDYTFLKYNVWKEWWASWQSLDKARAIVHTQRQIRVAVDTAPVCHEATICSV